MTSATLNHGNNSEDISYLFESFQLGLTYGIGYKIEVTPKFGILIDTQFFNGLTNISNDKNLFFTNNGSVLNLGAVIQL